LRGGYLNGVGQTRQYWSGYFGAAPGARWQSSEADAQDYPIIC
jgi:hypothetical protein